MWKYNLVIYQLAKYFEERGLCRDVIRLICFFINSEEREKQKQCKRLSENIMKELTEDWNWIFDEKYCVWITRCYRQKIFMALWRNTNRVTKYTRNIYAMDFWIKGVEKNESKIYKRRNLSGDMPQIPPRYFYSLNKKVDLNT
jgi:hypothetical protein